MARKRMAPKRPLPAEDPPPASSDEEFEREEEEEEEEEQESGESKSGSESDVEDDNKEARKKPSQPKQSSPPPPPPTMKKSEGGFSSTESESESELESESRRYTVKPIASKPIQNVETPPVKKQKLEHSPSSKQPATKQKVEVEDSKKGSKKKNVAEIEVEDSKKGSKKKNVAENGSLQKPGEGSKKPIFQRIWDVNDEIALLQGMIEFREKKGLDPSTNTKAFQHFIAKSLGHEFTNNQLANKIRVLKKKYGNNEGKGKDGEDRAFSKPHEQNIFDLSKKIWGASKSNETGGSGEQTPMPKVNGTSKKGKTGGTKSKTKSEASDLEPSQSLQRPKENRFLIPFEHSDPMSMLSCDKMLQFSRIGLDEDFLKNGWEMVDESKREELKDRWGKLQLAEMRVLAERAELIQYQTNLILEACLQATDK